LRHCLVNLVAQPPSPTTASQWSQESKHLREHWLNDVVYHGWPREVVEAPARFDETGVIETGKGYRIRKLRYEIVPGFYSAALLYEPQDVQRGSPAILNVNGHVGAPGKSVEYKQKRCIQFAKQGILALNLEWLSFGELSQSGNQHWYGAHLDPVGAHELYLFYLATRRGLAGAKRRFTLRPDRRVIIEDQLKGGAKSANVRWGMVTPAVLKKESATCGWLEKGGQRLRLEVRPVFFPKLRPRSFQVGGGKGCDPGLPD